MLPPWSYSFHFRKAQSGVSSCDVTIEWLVCDVMRNDTGIKPVSAKEKKGKEGS